MFFLLKATEQYEKSRDPSSWKHIHTFVAFVWMSPSMTRKDELNASRRRRCCCCCCCNTFSDDSMGEQGRSQPTVTCRSKMSRVTSNCVKKTRTLLFTKVHLELHQSQTEVCFQCALLSKYDLSQKRRDIKINYTIAVKNSSCLGLVFFFLYMFLSICKHNPPT